jgi:bla regulator protein blaR1
MNAAYLSPFANHLWQSTLFAGLAGLLTLALRKNHARVRHSLWFAASCKFLVPLSILIALGGHIQWRTATEKPSNVSVVMDEVSQPFTAPAVSSPLLATLPAASPLAQVLWGIWACGFLGITWAWWVRWRRLRTVVCIGTPVKLELLLQAMSSPALLEPGVFGGFQPVLFLPEGIFDRLTPTQLDAVIAHELCHVRHRDNLIAAIHMFVETAFWFHPLVWWIGKRMVEERERACDEEVLRLGSEPRVYAEGTLSVCKFYVESPLVCIAGITGANLKRRIEAIMSNRTGLSLNRTRKFLLATAGVAALAGPLVPGIIHAPVIRAQGAATTPVPAFEVASVKRRPPYTGGEFAQEYRHDQAQVTYSNTSLRAILANAYGVPEIQIEGPGWLDSERYDITAKLRNGADYRQIPAMLQTLLHERFKLTAHKSTRPEPVYGLVVAKSGAKLRPVEDGTAPSGNGSLPAQSSGGSFGGSGGPGGRLPVRGGPLRGTTVVSCRNLASLAATLSRYLDRTVVDASGLQGDYDIRVTFPAGDPDSDSALSSIAPVLQDELGLKLEPRKGEVETLVIDHAEKEPIEN